MTILNCPNCNNEIDTSEPHQFNNDIYDSSNEEHEEECSNCAKTYILRAQWQVTFTTESIELFEELADEDYIDEMRNGKD